MPFMALVFGSMLLAGVLTAAFDYFGNKLVRLHVSGLRRRIGYLLKGLSVVTAAYLILVAIVVSLAASNDA